MNQQQSANIFGNLSYSRTVPTKFGVPVQDIDKTAANLYSIGQANKLKYKELETAAKLDKSKVKSDDEHIITDSINKVGDSMSEFVEGKNFYKAGNKLMQMYQDYVTNPLRNAAIKRLAKSQEHLKELEDREDLPEKYVQLAMKISYDEAITMDEDGNIKGGFVGYKPNKYVDGQTIINDYFKNNSDVSELKGVVFNADGTYRPGGVYFDEKTGMYQKDNTVDTSGRTAEEFIKTANGILRGNDEYMNWLDSKLYMNSEHDEKGAIIVDENNNVNTLFSMLKSDSAYKKLNDKALKSKAEELYNSKLENIKNLYGVEDAEAKQILNKELFVSNEINNELGNSIDGYTKQSIEYHNNIDLKQLNEHKKGENLGNAFIGRNNTQSIDIPIDDYSDNIELWKQNESDALTKLKFEKETLEQLEANPVSEDSKNYNNYAQKLNSTHQAIKDTEQALKTARLNIDRNKQPILDVLGRMTDGELKESLGDGTRTLMDRYIKYIDPKGKLVNDLLLSIRNMDEDKIAEIHADIVKSLYDNVTSKVNIGRIFKEGNDYLFHMKYPSTGKGLLHGLYYRLPKTLINGYHENSILTITEDSLADDEIQTTLSNIKTGSLGGVVLNGGKYEDFIKTLNASDNVNTTISVTPTNDFSKLAYEIAVTDTDGQNHIYTFLPDVYNKTLTGLVLEDIKNTIANPYVNASKKQQLEEFSNTLRVAGLPTAGDKTFGEDRYGLYTSKWAIGDNNEKNPIELSIDVGESTNRIIPIVYKKNDSNRYDMYIKYSDNLMKLSTFYKKNNIKGVEPKLSYNSVIASDKDLLEFIQVLQSNK